MKSHSDTTIPFPQWAVHIMDTALSAAVSAEYINSRITPAVEICDKYSIQSMEVFDVKLFFYFRRREKSAVELYISYREKT